MKKFVTVITAASLCALMLSGCGEEADSEQSAVAETQESSEAAETETEPAKVYPEEAYLDNLNVNDLVELGEYAGVEITLDAPSVSDEQVETYIQMVMSSHKIKNEVTGRAVAEGDVADINYVGKKDGVAFEGGTADNYELEIGSNTFIDGFEDGVIGMKTGETKDLNLTFPENYGNAELAGAEVVFTVTLNKIYEQEMPTFDDAFVAGLNVEGVTTAEGYRQYVYDNYMEQAQSQYESELESAVLEAVHGNANFKADPEEMIERYYDRLLVNNQNYLSYMAAMYGADVETLLGKTWEEYVAENETDMKEAAKVAVQQVVMLQAIAEQEGLTVSDEDVEKDIEDSASEYGYESADAYKEAIGDEIKGYREFLTTEKVTEYLVEQAKVTQNVPETEAEETASEETEGAETEEGTGAETEGTADAETEGSAEAGTEETGTAESEG